MGYRTYHSLEIVVGDEDKQEFHEKEISDLYNEGYSLFEDDQKWYDHDINMLAYSEKYPSMVFAIHGDGEESDDKWVTYYKNGQSYTESKIKKDIKYNETMFAGTPAEVPGQYIILDLENMSLVIDGKSKQTVIFGSEATAKLSAKKRLIKDYQIIKLEI